MRGRRLVVRVVPALALLVVAGIGVVLVAGRHGSSAVSSCGSGAGSSPCPAGCTDTVGPSADLQATLRSAVGGAVVCLKSGDYRTGTRISGVTPSRVITLRPAPGATVRFSLGVTLAASISNLAISGFTAPSNLAGGLGVDSDGGFIRNVSITHDNFDGRGAYGQGQLTVRDTVPRAGILIADNTFIGVSPCATDCGEGTIGVFNTGGDNDPDGVTIAHNLISGGLADGINIGGHESGTRIVDNKIVGKLQGTGAECAPYGGVGRCPHTDGWQSEGVNRDLVISGNYFADDTDGMLQADGASTGITVTDNVFAVADVNTERAVQVSGWIGGTFAHNTLNAFSTWDATHAGDRTSGLTLTNNVFARGFGYGIQTEGGQFANESYNLTTACPHACGPHDIASAPHFRGGANPASFNGWRLVPGTPGSGDASDGRDRGIDS